MMVSYQIFHFDVNVTLKKATSFLDNRSLEKQLEEKEYEVIDWLGLKKFPASSQSSRKNRIY